MTREEAKSMRLFTQLQESKHDITWKTTTSEITSDYELLVDKIYDDFESRTCENCLNNDICPILDSFIAVMQYEPDNGLKTFGCNKFTRKKQ